MQKCLNYGRLNCGLDDYLGVRFLQLNPHPRCCFLIIRFLPFDWFFERFFRSEKFILKSAINTNTTAENRNE